MADFPVTGDYVYHGPNESRINVVEHVLAQALANTDTLSVTVPEGVDKKSLPIEFQVYTTATPAVRQTTLGMTNHNQTTGVTTFTATGAVANGSRLVILYAEPGA